MAIKGTEEIEFQAEVQKITSNLVASLFAFEEVCKKCDKMKKLDKAYLRGFLAMFDDEIAQIRKMSV